MTAVVFAAGCTPKEDNDSDVKVTTHTPQYITSTTAVCGGAVIVSQGLSLTELGVCWGTDSEPTVEDSHLSISNWSESYVCVITGLAPATTYHVRAYALCGSEYYYGEDKSFTTKENGGGGDDHEYVDLGLPSGTLWATCNVGATTPEGYGDYFAWGETQPKSYYNWSTYKYCNCNGDTVKLTKYCNKSDYGNNYFTDNLTTLESDDDAATANWGNDWCIPSGDQWIELWNNTNIVWAITSNGVFGRLFTASNGNSLFLPAAGYYREDDFYNNDNSNGYYWWNSLCTSYPFDAWSFYFDSGSYCYTYRSKRCDGRSVRAVRAARQN
jgi:hypothetical protein